MDQTPDSSSTSNLPTIPPSRRVKIFVGRKNRSILVDRATLSKSPTLLSYIVDDPIQGSFIMRPQLMTTHYEDFMAVAQFLRSGEYTPLLVENPEDKDGPKILRGLKGDEEYAKELVKGGKLYGLAGGFGVEGMAELVFRKVSEVDGGRYSIDSLVRVAEVVFRDGRGVVGLGAGADAGGGGAGGTGAGDGGTDCGISNGSGTGSGSGGGVDNENENDNAGQEESSTQDPLEEWIVGKLAYNFQEIMRTRRDKFFEVVKVTGKKMLFARVTEEVARSYRASGGKLPEPVIALD